jgi:hypothetical protein
MATTLPHDPKPGKRTGTRSLRNPITPAPDGPAPDGPPADFKGPLPAQPGPETAPDPADVTFDAVRDAVIDQDEAHDEQLEAELSAHAEAEEAEPEGPPKFGETHRNKVIDSTSGLYEPITWKRLKTGDESPFAEAPKLTELANQLLAECAEFEKIRGFKYRIMWRQKGGTKAGEGVLSGTTVLGGLGRHDSEAHILIWFAADNCKDAGLDDDTYKALMHHRLCDVGFRTTKDGERRPRLVRPIAVHPANLKRFGLWHTGATEVGQVISQQRLFEAVTDPVKGAV